MPLVPTSLRTSGKRERKKKSMNSITVEDMGATEEMTTMVLQVAVMTMAVTTMAAMNMAAMNMAATTLADLAAQEVPSTVVVMTMEAVITTADVTITVDVTTMAVVTTTTKEADGDDAAAGCVLRVGSKIQCIDALYVHVEICDDCTGGTSRTRIRGEAARELGANLGLPQKCLVQDCNHLETKHPYILNIVEVPYLH